MTKKKDLFFLKGATQIVYVKKIFRILSQRVEYSNFETRYSWKLRNVVLKGLGATSRTNFKSEQIDLAYRRSTNIILIDIDKWKVY